MMPMGKPPAMTLNGLAAETTKKMMKPTPRAPRLSSVELLTGVNTLMLLTFLYEAAAVRSVRSTARSEEHTSELPSLMRISYAVFCLKKNKLLDPNVRHRMEHNET